MLLQRQLALPSVSNIRKNWKEQGLILEITDNK